MKSMNGFLEKTLDQRIYQRLLDSNQSFHLTEILIAMQRNKGIDPAQAEENADVCINAVAHWESIHNGVYEDDGEVGNLLLDSLSDKGEAERKLILYKLYFGLTASPQEEDDAVLNERFWRYYEEQKNRKNAPSIAELEDMIRQKLKNYYLTPETMRTIIRKMESSGDHLATAAALSQNGHSFKCLVAMELYLNSDNSISIPEAANIACRSVETQAVADAVSKGFLSREVAKKLLIVASITSAIAGIAFFAFGAGGGVVAQNVATTLASTNTAIFPLPEVFEPFAQFSNIAGSAIEAQKDKALAKKIIGTVALGSGTIMATLSDKTADLIGNITTGFASMRGKSAASNVAGLRSLEYDKEFVDAKQEAPVSQDESHEEKQNFDSEALLF